MTRSVGSHVDTRFGRGRAQDQRGLVVSTFKEADQPIALPRRGLSVIDASTYVGVSRSKFLELVSDGRMPEPLRLDRRRIWDIRELDAAFDNLRDQESLPSRVTELDDGWGDATL